MSLWPSDKSLKADGMVGKGDRRGGNLGGWWPF